MEIIIQNIRRKNDFIVLVNRILFAAFIYTTFVIYINVGKFDQLFLCSVEQALKESGSSLSLCYLFSLRFMQFLSRFDEGFPRDFLLLLRGLIWVSFCISIPNSFYCGISQEVWSFLLRCRLSFHQKFSFTCFACIFAIAVC